MCALLIYVLWWQKPFEVDCPLILQGQSPMDIYALAWMNSICLSSSTRSMQDDFGTILDNDESFSHLNLVRNLRDG